MILSKLGKLDYQGIKLPNLLANTGLIFDLIKDQFIMQDFTITGNPRPEQLSYRIYGTTDYDWVLLMINNVIDPWYGWVKSDEVVRAFADKKYENFGGADGVHHYVDLNTNDEYYDVVNDGNDWFSRLDSSKSFVQFTGNLIPITNAEFELAENEKLRKIKILPRNTIRSFVEAFMRVYNGS